MASNPSQRLINLHSWLSEELEKIMALEEELWGIKARTDWLIQGERNITFFHLSTLIWRSNNRITQIMKDDGTWEENIERVKDIFTNGFERLYRTEQPRHALGQMLTNKYLTSTHLRGETRNQLASCIWRACKAGGIVFNKRLKWSIANGDKACLWNDFWLPLGPLRNQIEGPLTEVENRLLVKSFLANMDSISFNLPHKIVQEIRGIPVAADPNQEDILIWAYSKDGCFSLKSAYLIAKGINILNLETSPHNWVWRASTTPRIKFFLWLCTHHSIPTKEVLGSRGFFLDPTCNLEFFRPNLDAWLKINCGINSMYPRPRMPWKILFPQVVWTLWLHWNKAIFQTGKIEVGTSACCVKKGVEFYAIVPNGPNKPRQTQIQVRWLKLPLGWTKLNTDGFVFGNLMKASGGGILRSSDGPDGPPIVSQTPANSLVSGDFGQEIHITNEVSHDTQEEILTETNAILGQSINFNKSELFCSPNIPQTDQESLAISLQVNLVQYLNKYLGGNSCGRKQQYLALQDAVNEAVFKAKELGFNRILILSTRPDGPPIVSQTPANSLVSGDFGQEIHITNEVSHDTQEEILTETNAILGQSINFNKSELFCSPNIPQTDQESLAISLQVNLVQYLNKYLATYKNKKFKKSGAAFEALNMVGVSIFSGGNSCGRKQQYLALQDAVNEAVFKAKELGFNRILILSTSTKLDKLCNHYRKPNWLEKTLYTDLQ
nr:putative ribonuclease h protein [Quercus suber]